MLAQNWFFFDWHLDWRNQTCTNGETFFWRTTWFKTKNLQCVSGHQDCNAWIKIKKNSSIESYSTTVELPTDTLMGETKLVATQKIKFEDSVKLVSKSAFGTLVPSRFWCRKNSGYFSIGWFVTTPQKSIGILMQRIKPENSELLEFEYGDKSKFIAPFGTFLSIRVLLQGK